MADNMATQLQEELLKQKNLLLDMPIEVTGLDAWDAQFTEVTRLARLLDLLEMQS